MKCLNAVFKIHDILVWIRIRNADLDPAIFVIDLQDANKKLIKKKVFLLINFRRYRYCTFTSMSKIKSPKEVTKQ
jgi:hypothetical protein